ncbi:MAG TPA: GNAT family N-acetyltransferase [Geminicoccus sp.]|jgi:ribosomal-protein-alanine N-acetyltransferase|uniref:GNAT family N-acetyltransferase n=1 Tax=Geminicoccus sp. TaxID=2024832 RepID=UPI002E301EC3|nr:GNAT family N-acetyltransferase [Geminicoccus sp.]HEX2526267.1 GNAT family N-acetyltransferase [Geminicoccus sp.]
MMALPRPGQIAVKNIGPFDLGRLARLHRGCFEDGWSRSDIAHLLSLPGSFGLIARCYERGLSAIDGLRGVGFAICRVVRDESELLSIGVLQPWRQRGVAGTLLEAAMARAHAAGAETMFLEVAVDNVPAQTLYEMHRFQRVGTRLDYYHRPDGRKISAYTMKASLYEPRSTVTSD